jgi:hypothetical protein
VFKKKKEALFGIDLPKEEDLFSSDSDVFMRLFSCRTKRKKRKMNNPCS